MELQRFQGNLQQIDQRIEAADMRQLVGQNQLDLGQREPARNGQRKQYHRTQPADHKRRDGSSGSERESLAAEAEVSMQRCKSCLPVEQRHRAPQEQQCSTKSFVLCFSCFCRRSVVITYQALDVTDDRCRHIDAAGGLDAFQSRRGIDFEQQWAARRAQQIDPGDTESEHGGGM